MQKLIVNWAKELLPPEIFDRLVANAMRTRNTILFDPCESRESFVEDFWCDELQGVWSKDTPEGHEFWRGVAIRLRVEPVPEWPKIPPEKT